MKACIGACALCIVGVIPHIERVAIEKNPISNLLFLRSFLRKPICHAR